MLQPKTSLSSFLEESEQSDSQRVLWKKGRSELRASDLSLLSGQPPHRTLRVALYLNEQLEIARALYALDGIAETLFLVPAELSSDSIPAFLRKAEINTLLTDTSIAENAEADDIACFSSLDELIEEYSTQTSQSEQSAKLTTRWILATSGTTGTPKLVSHTLQSLSRSVKPHKSSATSCWGLLYDLRRFAGLQVFLHSFLSHNTLAFPENDQGTFEEKVASLASAGCNAISATPTMWRKIMMSGKAQLLPLKQITLGGEIADQSILNALKKQFPDARITHIYASTEAGVGFSVKDGLEGFPMSLVGQTSGNVELKVDEKSHLLIRASVQEQHYLGEQENLVESDGWIDTGDLVERVGERYIFLGRANGAINVGGNKVFPEEVERTILAVEGVAGALVKAKRSSVAGSLVEALIVADSADSDHQALSKRVKEYCQSKLDPYKVPVFINVVKDLQLNDAGKAVRGANV